MHLLIASYLFQTKNCPLGQLGHLSINTAPAIADFSNKKIDPPIHHIRFGENEIPATGWLSFVAGTVNCDAAEATAVWDHFCDQLKKDITHNAAAKLEGIGNFYGDASGNIKFQQEELPAAFSPSVIANRVIHPQREHSILVGDKETTNTLMTEYFNEEPVKNDRWWIWALILGAVTIGIILIYLNDNNGSSYFGNAINYE